jgi:diguanylate cyclase (GGDEF)-like protein/putative nucleotidyltransferase with HDIG domain
VPQKITGNQDGVAIMSNLAKSYWLAIVLSGWLGTIWNFYQWHPHSQDLPKLVVYILAAMSTSGLKVRIPGIYSTLSMNYVFIIAGLLDLGLAGGILIGIVGVLCQTFLKARDNPRWHHLIFNLSAISLSVIASGLCLGNPVLQSLDRFNVCAIVTASLAYFLVNTLILSVIIALTTGKEIISVWKESFLWTAPQYLVGGVIATSFHLTTIYLGWVGMLFVLPVIYLLYRSYDIYLTRVDEQQKHISAMSKLHLRTIEALALAIDAKDDTTAAHLRRVQVYASEVGKELGLPAIEIEALNAAAILHDIGKLAVPEYIISKPGRLTPDEFEKMKIHPIVGAEILERVDFPYPVVPIVRFHHEKFDGTGYPDGLIGEEIPIGARILSAVDCLDALASDRQYRKAIPLDEAIQIVIQESGTSFDPKVVKILSRRYRELEAKAKLETVPTARLSSHIKVERGARPATGFDHSDTKPLPVSRGFHLSISDARREFQMLVEIANDLGSNLSLHETLALLAVRLEKTIEHDAVAVYVRHGDELVNRYAKGESYRLLSSLKIPFGHGLSGWVAENDVPIVNGSPSVESGYLNDPSKITLLRSAICIPLRARDNIVGVLSLYSLTADAFTHDHRRILLNISSKVGSVIENAIRFEQVQNAARTDELTGLLNSRALSEQLGNEVKLAAQTQTSLAVVVMDLDGFKKTNDEHGHIAGNRVLVHVSANLRRYSRSTDLVARLGGDEFVLVLSNPGATLSNLLERISDAVARTPFEVGTRTPLSISLGCAVYPDDASDPETLLEIADERMYEEKRRRQQIPPMKQVVEFPKVQREA